MAIFPLSAKRRATKSNVAKANGEALADAGMCGNIVIFIYMARAKTRENQLITEADDNNMCALIIVRIGNRIVVASSHPPRLTACARLTRGGGLAVSECRAKADGAKQLKEARSRQYNGEMK